MTATDASSVVACDGCGRKNRVPATAGGLPRCGSCRAALAWVTDADDRSYEAIASRAPVPVLVDLWAPWCGPCRTVGPSLERLAHEFAGRLKLVRVNVDEAPATAARFSVQGIPTLLLVERGAVIARQVGAAGEPALRAWIRTSLPGAARAD